MLPTEPTPAGEQPRKKIKPLYVLGAFCVVSAVMIGVGLLRDVPRGEPLVRSEYDAALARWQAKRPASYDMDIYFYSQNAPVDVHLEVRDGAAKLLTKNGVAMQQAARREEWTVDRLLKQIGEDLHIQEDPNLDFAVKPGVQVKLEGKFDESWGYPLFYRRLAHGSPVQYQYEVRAFKPIE
ncbi:MAG: hypothetical protein U0836_12260 [Pirellulales bacterium]